MALPCDYCQGSNCGHHKHTRFNTHRSKSFWILLNCESSELYDINQICKFKKSYAEGSSLQGVIGKDKLNFVDGKVNKD